MISVAFYCHTVDVNVIEFTTTMLLIITGTRDARFAVPLKVNQKVLFTLFAGEISLRFRLGITIEELRNIEALHSNDNVLMMSPKKELARRNKTHSYSILIRSLQEFHSLVYDRVECKLVHQSFRYVEKRVLLWEEERRHRIKSRIEFIALLIRQLNWRLFQAHVCANVSSNWCETNRRKTAVSAWTRRNERFSDRYQQVASVPVSIESCSVELGSDKSFLSSIIECWENGCWERQTENRREAKAVIESQPKQLARRLFVCDNFLCKHRSWCKEIHEMLVKSAAMREKIYFLGERFKHRIALSCVIPSIAIHWQTNDREHRSSLCSRNTKGASRCDPELRSNYHSLNVNCLEAETMFVVTKFKLSLNLHRIISILLTVNRCPQQLTQTRSKRELVASGFQLIAELLQPHTCNDELPAAR